MPKTWFVGDADCLSGLPAAPGDALVPLDAFTQAALGAGDGRLPDLAAWESESVHHVVRDLRRLVDGLDKSGGQAWLGYGGHDLRGVLAKADPAFSTFPKQQLAHRIAAHLRPTGAVVAAAVSDAQIEGLRAALGREPERWP